MACRPNDCVSSGYDESRFESSVNVDVHCPICFNVMKDARMCHNQHMFCRSCIEEHLRVNPQRCPQCQDNLTVATLLPARFVNNLISKLKINCDYASRGCPEFINVEDLERHVENCGFAPVLCSNERCGLEINKRDKIKHETELCEYRKIASHDFAAIKEIIERTYKDHNDQLQKEMLGSRKEMKDVQQSLSTVTKEMMEMKAMMFQMLEKMNTNVQHIQTLTSPTELVMNSVRNDILIAGGYPYGSSKSVEIFSWKEKKWFEIASLEKIHSQASSFIYNDNIFVFGGKGCRSIETLNLNQLPLTWKTFHGELPYECNGHQTVVCKQQILHIGGSIVGKEISDMISEVQITGSTSYVLKELCHMPEPRFCHAAEVVDDKVLIFGGERKRDDLLNSVLEFDPRTRTFKEMPSLPHPLTDMATVQWRDQVVLLGGYDGIEILNSVIMYDIKTGENTVLPSMLEKRRWCCAVITGDTIVVMGGMNNKNKDLKSVEYFKMGSSSSWKYLPLMNKQRSVAIAEVLPLGKKDLLR
ncbi:kelch-like protein 5 [Xenia sp. Carnegie-2017]|uniref:kelch-like protein 5 n=1 Tax=Xenia sp. Carnegie-2017 TaxID=2897299 RepID=UPI001F03C6B1|nr:kelch-like protein 5 [Xenia sp. Carnegie-2017]XP_046842082.1 kelch-like protein 5 [Xenia sp. Carnegie-2017]